MNQSSDSKSIGEKVSKDNVNSYKNEKDKQYSLQSFMNKVNKVEANTFGNYFVDFGEMFNETSEYQGYVVD
jgi:hypothetical protein